MRHFNPLLSSSASLRSRLSFHRPLGAAASFLALVGGLACGGDSEPLSDEDGTVSAQQEASAGQPTPGLRAGLIADVENTGADCEVAELPAFDDLSEEQALPDPFLGLDGERVATVADWRCHREETLQLAEKFIYGSKPEAPQSVTGTVTPESLVVSVEHEGRTVQFEAAISMPEGTTGPVPAVIGYGGSAYQETILAEGVAYINFDVASVGDETTRNPKQGAFYQLYPERQDAGMLTAWAWGVSRIVDVLASAGSELINAQGLGVHGCSRSGKGAFIAGAFDERIALTIPYESGMSGVPAFRLIVPEGGEVLRNTIEYRPWAGDAYRDFLVLGANGEQPELQEQQNNESGQLQFRLPVDTHQVIGLVAPRGLLVMGNPSIANLAPRAEHLTVLAGAEVYAALGASENLSYISNTTNGQHCTFREEFVPPLQQNLRKFLKGDESANTGELNPSPQFSDQSLTENVSWERPTLE